MTYAVFPLPEITYPLEIGTLGMCLATGHEISMHCSRCNNYRRLNLVRLARHVGPKHGASEADLRKVVWCTECGARGEAIGFMIQPPTHPYSRVSAVRLPGAHAVP